MSGPTTLTVTLVGGAGTVVLSIPQILQSLDSTISGSPQTGYSSADTLIRSFFRAQVFTDGQGNWYPTNQIQKIVAS